jgi:hypothetical protein
MGAVEIWKMVIAICIHGVKKMVATDYDIEEVIRNTLMAGHPGCWECGSNLVRGNEFYYYSVRKMESDNPNTRIEFDTDQGESCVYLASEGLIYMTCSEECSRAIR